MLDIQFIRSCADQVRAAIANKGVDLDLDDLLAADKQRREAMTALEHRRARKNELSALIPKAAKEERPTLVDEAKRVRAEIEELEPRLADIQRSYQELMLRVPSVPRPEVPIGKGEADNVEIRRVGELPRSTFSQRTTSRS